MAGRGRGRGGSCQPLSEVNTNICLPDPPILSKTLMSPVINGTGRGRGRGLGALTPDVNDLASMETNGIQAPLAISPAAQFADADEKVHYTVHEYSAFDPKRVVPVGSGGLYQSVQKCTEVQHYHTKVAKDPKLTRGLVAGQGNGSEVDELLNGEPESLALVVEDFQAPGSLPIHVQEERVDFIRDVVICNFNGLDDFVIRPANNVHFAVFTRKLNNWYDDNAKRFPAPELGDLVCGGHYVALSSKTKNWCRVSLVNYKNNGEVILEKLDFGGFLHTFVTDVRCIRKIFCDFPIQAVRAKIRMAPGNHFELTNAHRHRAELEAEGRKFSVMTVDDETDSATGKRILGVILLVNENGTLRPYSFGGCFTYGYEFGSPTKR